MQFFSQAAFFGSSFYDVGSDYLVSEQFINGAAYIKDVANKTILEEYHKRYAGWYVTNPEPMNCTLIGQSNYTAIGLDGSNSDEFLRYSCVEKDIIWGSLVSAFIFMPGVLFWSLLAYQIRRNNLLLSLFRRIVLVVVLIPLVPLFPFILLLVKFVAIFNDGPQLTHLKTTVSLCEGQIESFLQLGLQVYIILHRTDRRPSIGVYHLYLF